MRSTPLACSMSLDAGASKAVDATKVPWATPPMQPRSDHLCKCLQQAGAPLGSLCRILALPPGPARPLGAPQHCHACLITSSIASEPAVNPSKQRAPSGGGGGGGALVRRWAQVTFQPHGALNQPRLPAKAAAAARRQPRFCAGGCAERVCGGRAAAARACQCAPRRVSTGSKRWFCVPGQLCMTDYSVMVSVALSFQISRSYHAGTMLSPPLLQGWAGCGPRPAPRAAAWPGKSRRRWWERWGQQHHRRSQQTQQWRRQWRQHGGGSHRVCECGGCARDDHRAVLAGGQRAVGR